MAGSKKDNQAAALRQILRRCSNQLAGKHGPGSLEREALLPRDVPRGHFAVYVGEQRHRHVVPVSLLARPPFQVLLRRAEEEFGFDYEAGVVLPCEESVFLSAIASARC